MRKYLVLILIVLIVLVINACASASADPVLVSDITDELMCTCGSCEGGVPLVVSDCDCNNASEMVSRIEKKLSQGQTKERIIQSFVTQYGEQVLVAPTNP